MQSLSAFFEDNKPLAFAIMFAALLVLIIVLFLLYRVLFGRRLRAASGGRARQPRLGIVDAYDLDRQRQLVLVRRDNVEHLVMIGGPNDVLVESSIVRTQSLAAGPTARDKEGVHPSMPAGAAPPQIPPAPYPPGLAPSVGPTVSPPPPPRQSLPFPAVGTGGAPPVAPALPSAGAAGQPAQAPALNQAGERLPPRAPSLDEGASAQTAGFAPVRQAPSPARAGAPARTGAPGPSPAPPPTQRPSAPGSPPRPAPPPRAPASLPPRPNLAASLPPRPSRPVTPVPPRTDSGASAQRSGSEAPGTLGAAGEPEARPARPQDSAPPVSATPGQAPSAAAAPSVGDSGKSGQPVPKNLETLESLEEEMAKLLGRPAANRDTQSG